MAGRVEGKVALITGAARGQGGRERGCAEVATVCTGLLWQGRESEPFLQKNKYKINKASKQTKKKVKANTE